MGVVLLVTWMIQSFIFQFQTLVWSKTMSQITKSCSRKHIRGNDIMWIHLVTQALNICGPAAVFVFVWYLAIRSGGSNQWELEETRNSAWVQSGRLPLHSPLSLLPPFTWCGRVFMFSLSPFKPTRFCLEHYHPITSLPTNLDLLFSLLSDVFGHSCDPPSTLQPILLQLFIIPPTYERHYLHVDWCQQSRLAFNISNTVAMTSKTAGERRWKNEVEWWHSCTTSLVSFWLTFFFIYIFWCCFCYFQSSN